MVSWISSHLDLILEIVAVVFGVLYLVLIAKNKVSGWIYGIIGSFISIFLFVIYAQLYAEAVLYVYYVIAGFYGWYHWGQQKEVNEVYAHPWSKHLKLIGLGAVLSVLFYYLVTHFFQSAQRPLIDSFTTIFSFLATYITTKKWIENWIYWIVIDLVSTYLYYSRGLEIYALLMLVYSVMAVYGYLEWKKLKVVAHG